MIAGLKTVEDRRFDDHFGIDLRGIARAAEPVRKDHHRRGPGDRVGPVNLVGDVAVARDVGGEEAAASVVLYNYWNLVSTLAFTLVAPVLALPFLPLPTMMSAAPSPVTSTRTGEEATGRPTEKAQTKRPFLPSTT